MSKLIPEAAERLEKLRALLAEEEREVRGRADALLTQSSPRELEQSGVLLRKGRVADVTAALFGRVRLTVADDPSRPGHVDRFDARPGAVVWAMERDDDGRLQQVAAGIVARRRRGSLEIVFESSEQVAETDEAIDLLLAPDEVTLRRMREGLEEAARAEGRPARLLEVVLGAVAPRPTRMSEQVKIHPSLHEDQRLAALHGILAEDVGLIHGPPGTGKTRVLVEVILQCVARGDRVLALTASNAAIDHLALSLLEAEPGLPLARLGQPARVHPALEQHTLVALTEAHERRELAKGLVDQAFQLLRQARRRSARGRDAWQKEREARVEAGKLFADARRLERQAAADVLDRSRVLCGTLTGLRDDVLGDEPFDVLVVDEASQALTPALVLGALRARRVVLAGDHRQLPPTVISPRAAKEGLGETAFSQLTARDAEGKSSHMLTVQHRMHEALMTFPSTRFYETKLRAHPAVAQHTLVELGVLEGPVAAPARVLDVIDTAGTGHEEQAAEGGGTSSASKENPGEASLVARVVRDLVQGGLAPGHIGVVTPYSGQVALLSSALADLLDQGLEIDSVDGFQGREKEAIVFSAVRSNAAGEVGFLGDERRLNVAITRARRKLVVIGDSATLSSDERWRALFDHAIATSAYRSAFELPEGDGGGHSG
jgi:ATP-dependent RNA/DNA helicase IGHMBP2